MFKYLDTMALKEEKSRNGGSYDGHTTLRRNAAAKNSSGPLSELQKIRRQNVDSGYSTSDGYDKRWSQELNTANGSSTVSDNGNTTKWSPTQSSQSLSNNDKSSPLTTNYSQFQSQSSGNSTPTLSSPAGNNNNTLNSNQSVDEYIKPTVSVENLTPTRGNSLNGSNNNRFVSRNEISIGISHAISKSIHLLSSLSSAFAFIAIYHSIICTSSHSFFYSHFITFIIFIISF